MAVAHLSSPQDEPFVSSPPLAPSYSSAEAIPGRPMPTISDETNESLSTFKRSQSEQPATGTASDAASFPTIEHIKGEKSIENTAKLLLNLNHQRKKAIIDHAYSLERQTSNQTHLTQGSWNIDIDPHDEFSDLNVSDTTSVFSYMAQAEFRPVAKIQEKPLEATWETEESQNYFVDLVKGFWTGNTIRSVEAKLFVLEAIEHFDCFNDLFFIFRVAFSIPHKDETIAPFTLLWLISIWCTSFFAYLFRRYLIYHRIRGEHIKLFYPFYVFYQIPKAANSNPEVLYMFDRVLLTHSLLLRFIEDLPQIIVSSLFIRYYGKDVYAIFIIGISACMFIAMSFRMGLKYPFCGTISLLLSAEPPVDAPERREASHITYHYAVYMSFTCLLWAITAIVSMQYARYGWKLFIFVLAVLSTISSILLFCLWIYYSKQSQVDVDQQFLLSAEDNRNVEERLPTVLSKSMKASPITVTNSLPITYPAKQTIHTFNKQNFGYRHPIRYGIQLPSPP